MTNDSILFSLAASLKNQDRDRFLLALLSTEDVRPDLIILYAFHLELARIRTLVKERDAGLFRLEWWREVLELDIGKDRAERGSVPFSPLAEAMRRVVARHGLPRPMLDALLTAREDDLTPVPFATVEDLCRYADATAGTLAELAGRILGATDAVQLLACRRAGALFARVGLLRALPFHFAAGWISIPADMLQQGGEALRNLPHGSSTPPIPELTEVVSSLLDSALTDSPQPLPLPANIRPAALHAMVAHRTAYMLRRSGCNPFLLPADLRPFVLPLWLLWGQLSGRWWAGGRT